MTDKPEQSQTDQTIEHRADCSLTASESRLLLQDLTHTILNSLLNGKAGLEIGLLNHEVRRLFRQIIKGSGKAYARGVFDTLRAGMGKWSPTNKGVIGSGIYARQNPFKFPRQMVDEEAQLRVEQHHLSTLTDYDTLDSFLKDWKCGEINPEEEGLENRI